MPGSPATRTNRPLPERVSRQAARLLVHHQRLRDVAAAAKRLHQEAIAGFAKRRAGDELAARALGRTNLRSAQSEPAARQPFERLQLELLELAPATLQRVVVDLGQESGPQQLERGLRLLVRLVPVLAARGRSGGPDCSQRLLCVDPDRFGEREP
jgi:hypothetical protein